jgi:hypothetical protein
LEICYEMCQTSTVQGFVHCRSSVTQASVKVVTRDALLGHTERRRPHLNESADAATSN